MAPDSEFMRQALALAERGRALASPGAMVGAVIVAEGKVVGSGYYTYDDLLHAEIKALQEAGAAARGATIYTTLEPCSHHGRTGPCAKALIDAGIKRVVTAMQDPNPEVNGQGVAMLRASSVDVEVGLFENDAMRLNDGFIVYKTQKRPFGILKLAMTLDGKIATRTGESKWITSEDSRHQVQQLRHHVDAIVTGSGTYLKDTPALTDRTELPRRRPLLRVILDRRGRIDHAAGFMTFRGTLPALCEELYRHEIQSFMLECGPDLAFNALQSGLIDKVIAFVAPKILGGRDIPAVGGGGFERLTDLISLADVTSQSIGPDIMITGYLRL